MEIVHFDQEDMEGIRTVILHSDQDDRKSIRTMILHFVQDDDVAFMMGDDVQREASVHRMADFCTDASRVKEF